MPHTPNGEREAQATGMANPIIPDDACAAARVYLARGWRIVPIPPRAKGPRLSGWQNLRITEEELPLYLQPDSNLGLLLGAPSGGIVDVDLDAPAARAVAGELLPPTGMVHGRASAPRSHYWYHCPTLNESRIQYHDPELTTDGGKPVLLVEIRSSGHQTCVPPSVHPSGERLQWQGSALDPATIASDALKRACARVAAAAVLALRWREGIRNDLSLALSGYLARCGWAEEETLRFLGAVCHAARDEEWRNRIDACKATYRKVAANEPATGLPTLQELLGDKVAQQLAQWLGGSFQMDTSQLPNINIVAKLRSEEPPAPESDDEPVAIDLSTLEPRPQEWLVEQLVPAHHATNLYGDSESCKSLLCLRLALSVITGRPFLGYAVKRRGVVLYADFELSADAHVGRWHAVAAGMGYEHPPEGLLYYRFHADLFSSIVPLQRLITRYRPVLLIIDSLGFALGKPNDHDFAVNAYRYLDTLPCATVVVDHTPKPTPETPAESAREFGSSYKRHYARSALHVVVQGRDRGERGLVLRQVKSNFGDPAPELPVRVRFETEDNLLLRVEFVAGAQAMESATALFGRRGEVLNALQQLGEATVSQLVKETGTPDSTVRAILNGLTRIGVVEALDGYPRRYRVREGEGGHFATSQPIINCEVANSPDALETLIQQLANDDFAPLDETEQHQLRQLWQAAQAHGYPRLQLPSLLITGGESAWLDAIRLVAGTPDCAAALTLLQRTNGHSDALPATPSDGDAESAPDAKGAGDWQGGTTAPAPTN
ncbi:MAG: AAA family ATPase [Armatimonadota bacterium]|nr:AAA family ATPase [Armatimonadota bacterium]